MQPKVWQHCKGAQHKKCNEKWRGISCGSHRVCMTGGLPSCHCLHFLRMYFFKSNGWSQTFKCWEYFLVPLYRVEHQMRNSKGVKRAVPVWVKPRPHVHTLQTKARNNVGGRHTARLKTKLVEWVERIHQWSIEWLCCQTNDTNHGYTTAFHVFWLWSFSHMWLYCNIVLHVSCLSFLAPRCSFHTA